MTPLELIATLGAHRAKRDGETGVRFAVWAPEASHVSVVGDFNEWDGRCNPMARREEDGIWECFIPNLYAGHLYKYEIHDRQGALLPLKSDPAARLFEHPPATASVVPSDEPFVWTDHEWMATRDTRQCSSAPIVIYEVHIESWLEVPSDSSVWVEAGSKLIQYVQQMGFTHIELLPITEHPFGGSWGYQPLGMFAPSARYGTPSEFAAFIDACHAAGLGVIMDWVPAHFPDDVHGLANFDGTALYEHADPRQGVHPDWDTHIYNVGRDEVATFLIASALFWLREFHVDGLRVDAVASMLYLDYSRESGQWVANEFGGRENLESVEFLRQLNDQVAQHGSGAMVIAEESTAWPGVTASRVQGGLGFRFKWNMGWMHDSLTYMQLDPIYRRHHHNTMTFSTVYAWAERFILPLSHDEVVHGKGSLLSKMPGDTWQRFANLRAYLGFMWGHPGKKLLFMGNEIAQPAEWDHDGTIDWDVLSQPLHRGMQRVVQDLNSLYLQCPALFANDDDPGAFAWVISDDAQQSVFAFRRQHGGRYVLVISNMTPVPRYAYRVGVPTPGAWIETLNTDSERYGGSNMGNDGVAQTQSIDAHGMVQSLVLTLPPLATLFFQSSTGASP